MTRDMSNSGELNSSRLESALSAIGDEALRRPLARFLSAASNDDLYHIDVSALAEAVEIDRRSCIDLCLRGVQAGIFALEWVFHCPTCGGVAKESLQLSATREHDYCPVCRVDFRNTLDENIEVFFSISEELLRLPEGLRAAWEAGMMESIRTRGRYDWKGEGTVTGVEVFTNPVFRDIFGDQTLPVDQSLEIKSATILFTDVTGSTAMYERLGDANAYRLIRDHFNIVFDAVARFSGTPIKTIGDAVMGVFSSETAAVRAAFAMIDGLREAFGAGNTERIRLKIGAHRGPVIAVTLNSRIDYFGRTVNLAARTQGASGPDQLAMLEGFVRAPGVVDELRTRISSLSRARVAMKGIGTPVVIYRAAL